MTQFVMIERNLPKEKESLLFTKTLDVIDEGQKSLTAESKERFLLFFDEPTRLVLFFKTKQDRVDFFKGQNTCSILEHALVVVYSCYNAGFTDPEFTTLYRILINANLDPLVEDVFI